jgi:hypothetical protein
MEEEKPPFLIQAKCYARALIYGSNQVAMVDGLPGLGRMLCEGVVAMAERKSCANEYLRKYPQKVAHATYDHCIADEMNALPDPCHGYGRDDITGKCRVTIR